MKKLITFFVLSMAMSLYAETYYTTNNASPFLRIYNGYTNSEAVSVKIFNGTNNIIVTIGDVATTLMVTGAVNNTVALLETSIEACTNISGQVKLKVDAYCSLGTDTFSNKLTAVTNTLTAAKWTDVGRWNTINANFIQTYSPGMNVGGNVNGGVVDRIYGMVDGTGTVTVAAYVDGVETYTRTQPTGTTDFVTCGQVDINWPLRLPPTSSLLIRGSRATQTTTTSRMGLIINSR